MLVILKIPVVYLCAVVWWAVKAKPAPLEPVLVTAPVDVDPRPGWRFLRTPDRTPHRGPHGRPTRGPSRQIGAARAGRR